MLYMSIIYEIVSQRKDAFSILLGIQDPFAETLDAVAVRVFRMADGDRPGLALGDRMAAAAGRAGRVRGPGIRDEKFGGVVMPDSFGNVSFRGQTGKVEGDI